MNDDALDSFTYQSYKVGMTLTETPLQDAVMDSMAKRYTSALAQSMASTREALAGSILSEAFGGSHRPWEEEVNFD